MVIINVTRKRTIDEILVSIDLGVKPSIKINPEKAI